jgi:type III pantothenate kinase
VLRVFADLGNSRLKWGRVVADGTLDIVALPLNNESIWADVWARWNPGAEPSEWAVSTVNPPLAMKLADFLKSQPGARLRWFRSAADVPVRHELENVHTAGTDRAFAVVGALVRHQPGRPGIVISCGSAITVERVSSTGVWEGGAIAPGYRLAAESLHALSTQLTLVSPAAPPPPWGRSTKPALEAGVFWGTVGAIRALVAGQAANLEPEPWVVWSGGDAALLRPSAALVFANDSLAPALVLEGIRSVCEV